MTLLPVSNVSSVVEYELFRATGAVLDAEIERVTTASVELPVPSEIR